MRILMIFLDGVGLGHDDQATNPFAAADLPTLSALAGGNPWLRGTDRQQTARATFIPTDPRLGIPGRPQSATGQAAILTGKNVPQIIGKHYGPKPDPDIRRILANNNFFIQVINHNRKAGLVEAYPPRWHQAIARGRILPASYQDAARAAGLPFMGEKDLRAGVALSGDWTGEGWHTQLGYNDTPILTPYEAGVRLVKIARQYDFTFFSHWMTDVVGHRGTIDEAINLLRIFDQVMAGILNTWDDAEGLVIITSDHGNIEAIGDRKHTENNVPTVIIGQNSARLSDGLTDLTHLVPLMTNALFG